MYKPKRKCAFSYDGFPKNATIGTIDRIYESFEQIFIPASTMSVNEYMYERQHSLKCEAV